MIPKIIHQIWVGKKKIPGEFKEFSEKWKLMYPDFKYILWDDNLKYDDSIIPSDKMKYYHDDEYPIAFKADILRYEILNKHGGVYVDMDTEPLRRMGKRIFQYNFFAGIQNNGDIANGLIGSEPNCEVIKSICDGLIDRIETSLKKYQVSKKELDFLSGPSYLTFICKEKNYFSNPKFRFFESEYFYPYWFLEKHRRYENFKMTCPKAYSVHHWADSWHDS